MEVTQINDELEKTVARMNSGNEVRKNNTGETGVPTISGETTFELEIKLGRNNKTLNGVFSEMK